MKYLNNEQKKAALEKVEALRPDLTLEEACKKVGITSFSYYNYKKQLAKTVEVVTYKNNTPKTERIPRQKIPQLTVIMGSTDQVTELLRGMR